MPTIAELEAEIRFHEYIARNARDMMQAASFEMRNHADEAKKLRKQLAQLREKD